MNQYLYRLSIHPTFINNKYAKAYFSIISKRVVDPAPRHEKHHILPKSLFRDFAKSPDNLVRLSYREHFVCHLLLTKVFEVGSPEYRKMAWAVHRMAKGEKYLSKEYELARLIHVKNLSFTKGRKCITNGKTNKYIRPGSPLPDGFKFGITRSEEHEAKLVIHRQNRLPASEKTKRKISASNKGKTGRKVTDETRSKLSQSLSGRKITWNEKLVDAHAKRKQKIRNGEMEAPKPYKPTKEQRSGFGAEYIVVSPSGERCTINNLRLFAETNDMCHNALAKTISTGKPVPEPKNKFTEARINTTGWRVLRP